MVLEQIGVLLELKGANPFRVRSYQNASRTLGALEEDLWIVTSEGRLTDVKGIGKCRPTPDISQEICVFMLTWRAFSNLDF